MNPVRTPSRAHTPSRALAAAVLCVLVLAACGGGESSDPDGEPGEKAPSATVGEPADGEPGEPGGGTGSPGDGTGDPAEGEPGEPGDPGDGEPGEPADPGDGEPGEPGNGEPGEPGDGTGLPGAIEAGWSDDVEAVDCSDILAGDERICGIVEVLVDPADPAEGRVDISFVMVKGRDPQTRPMLAVLQGGPGGASSEMAAWFEAREFTQVFIDQRGTGFADSDFDCHEADEAFFDTLSLGSVEADELLLDLFTDCAKRFGDDALLEHTTTSNHAADVVAVMQALDTGPWAVYGVSYGTTVALEILRSGPDDLLAAVLDGVYPPGLDAEDALVASAGAALDALGAACDRSPDCSQYADDLPGIVDRLIERYDESPVTLDLDPYETGLDEAITVIVDGRRLAAFIMLFMYSEFDAAYLPALLASIDEDEDEALRFFASGAVMAQHQQTHGLDEATYFAVTCHDQLPFSDGLDAGDGELTAFTAALSATTLQSACEPWERTGAPPAYGEPVDSDVPVLLLSGEFDPVTPAAFAEQAAATLGDATLVHQRGRSHGIWPGNDCIGEIVDDFVSDPHGELDTSCARTGARVQWPVF